MGVKFGHWERLDSTTEISKAVTQPTDISCFERGGTNSSVQLEEEQLGLKSESQDLKRFLPASKRVC